VFPGQTETTCDGIDNDCEPSTHESHEDDGDGEDE